MRVPGFVLGDSWLVISRVISRVTIVITYIAGLITPLITTHEPPSSGSALGISDKGLVESNDALRRIEVLKLSESAADRERFGLGRDSFGFAQGAQYPLIKEYTFNHNIKAPTI